MPNPEFMNGLSQDVNSRMQGVSDEAYASLLNTSYVEQARQQQFETAAQETTIGEDIVNIGKSFIEGVTRGAGESAAIGAQAELTTLSELPEDVLNAYNIMQDPNSDDLSKAAALQVLQGTMPSKLEDVSFGQFGAVQSLQRQRTYQEFINDALAAQKSAKEIVDVATSLVDVDQRNRDKLANDMAPALAEFDAAWKSEDLSLIAKTGKSLGAALEGVKALVQNPSAVLEYTAESIGQAPFGLIGATGYAGTVFNDALEDYQKNNNGKLPSKADMREMMLWSAGAGSLDKIADAKLLGSITKVTKPAAQTAKEAVKDVAQTTVTEGITEAAQTAIEEDLSKLRDVQDYGKLLEAGLIGAASGATISTAGSATKAVADTTSKVGTTVAERNRAFVERRNAQQSAIESGDVSQFTDVSAPDYSLKTSVEVMAKAAAKNPEKQQELYETAKEQTLTKRAELTSMQEELLELGTKENPTEADAKRVSELETSINKLEPEVSQSVDLVRGMKPIPVEDVATDVETATSVEAAPEVKQEAARRSFGSFRAEPDLLTAEQAEALADADNGLTEQENAELRTHANIQRSLETLDSVGSHIVTGGVSKDTGREMLGIKDYRDLIVSDNRETRKQGLSGLAAFANRHLEKATAIEQAYRTFQTTKQPQKVSIGSGKELTIDNRSRKLVSTVRQEANTLQNAFTQYSNTYPLDAAVEPVAQETVEPVQTQAEVETTTPETAQETVVTEDVVTPVVQDTTIATPVEQTLVAPEVADATLATTVSSPVDALVVPEQEKDYSLAKELTSKEDTNNLVSQYFKPSNKKSPLNKFNDFATRLKNNTENMLANFYEGTVPTEAVVVANNFANFNTSFVNALDKVFEPLSMERGDFRSDDYVQYLVDENGQLPANIKTAMAVGAYEWLIANGKESTIKSRDSIRSLLGLTDEDYFEPELYNIVPVGSRRTSVINSMGTAAFRSLNLKMDATAPVDAQTRLETAMGLWAYESLVNAGVLKEAKIKGADIKNAYGTLAPKAIQDIKPADQYVMTELNLTPGIENVITTNREKSSFMNDVFGSMSERPMPSFKPMKGTFKVSKSTQKVPERQRKILEEDQKKPYYLRSDTVGSFFEIEPDLRLQMMGYNFDLDSVMEVNRAGVEGANRSIERELEIAEEWYMEVQNQDAGIDTPFYLPHTVWKQGRMGLGTRFNPQSSKIHRYMTNRGEWNHTFDFNTAGENYFLLAVGEGFDIEVPKFATDNESTSEQKALDKLTSVLAKEDIRNAIDAMKDIMLGNNTRENQELVAKGVEAGEGKMKSYLAIVEMAKYENAKAAGETSFKHTLAREVDGITNGVCITTLQFSSDDLEQMFTLLQRMGIYDSELTYNEWQANPANKDSYKSLAENWQRAIEAEVQNQPQLQKQYVEVSKLFGSFGQINEEGEMIVTSDGRKIAKSPLMTSIYGAGIATIADHLGSQAVEKIYANLQKAYNSQNSQLVKDTLATLNALTGGKYTVKKGSDILTFKISKGDIKKIKQAVANVYQAPLSDAMEAEYSVSFDSRTKLNAASNFAHELFMSMYNAELAKQPVVTNEVQQSILEQLKQVTPIVNTANSKLASKDLETQLDTGLMLSGFEMAPAPEEVKVTIKGKFEGKKSSTSGGQLRTFKAPGAAPIPTMTQSVDAATQVAMMGNATVLNVHDASYISGNNFGKDKEVYNQGFLSINYQYSIPQEIAQMLTRVVDGFKQSGLEVPAEAVKQAGKSILGIDNANIDQITSAINGLASDHMQAKQKVMKSIVRSEQYSNGDDSAYVPAHKFGSSPQRTLEDNFTFDDTRSIDRMNTEEVFDKLQDISVVKDSAIHFNHLRDVLNGVVNQVITPFNLHIGSSTETETIGSTDGVDMFIVNQLTGSLPTSGSLANGIRMSSSEVFVHELVHNVSMVGVEQKFAERNELIALWHQAKKVVTVRDFMNDPTMSETDPTFDIEYAAAEARYNHVFKPTRTGSKGGRARADHLHEFVALGMTNENFRNALSKVEYANKAEQLDTATGSVGRLAQGIYNWFQRLLSNIQSKMLSTYGKTADKQLEELFKAFAGIDSSAKNLLKAKALRVVKPAQNFVETQSDKIEQVMGEPVRKFKGVASNAIVKAVKEGRAQTVSQIIEEQYKTLRKSNKTAAELFLSLSTEARGRFNAVGVLHDMKRMANKNIDRFRMQVRTDVRKAINDSFSEKLTVKEREALSHVFIKTDIGSLLDTMSQDEVLTLIQNPVELDKKIKEYETQVKAFEGMGNYYIKQAKNLGRFMITGKSGIANAMMNAENIADALGTHRSMPKFARDAEPVIDTLASLYAIKNTSQTHRNLVNSLVAREVTTGNTDNGISFSLNMVSDLRKKSKEEFEGNTRHYQKGFMADKVNPSIDVKVGLIEDKEEMEAQGYSLGSALSKDPNDPDKTTKYLYVNNFGGITANIGGVAYLMTDTHRGTDAVMSPTGGSNVTVMPDFVEMKRKSATDSLANWSSTNIGSRSYSIPLVNQDGEIINYRYVMQDQVKDDVMERDTSFDDVMGITYSTLAVKDDMKQQNSDLVNVLKQMYVSDVDNRDEYVMIGERSADQHYREIYRMLPPEMRKEAKVAFGIPDGLFVRKDSIDLLFGYHKYTLANVWKLPKDERKVYQQVFTSFVEMIFGKKAAMRVRQGEDLMTALSKTIKDIIVIKSGLVTLGNMVSNLVLLKMMGVPLTDILKGHKDSFAAMRRYKKQNQEAEQLRLKLASANLTNNQRTVYESRLVELEDDIAANPVINLIDQGLLSTIVEDVDTEVEEYKLRQRVRRKLQDTSWEDRLEDATNRIPQGLRDVAKEALVMQGSNLYDFLSEAAQFSDFGARYVLYKHMVEQKNMGTEEAAGYVMDIFIDYDLPTHKGVQYLNDLGLLMFTKYIIRVQRIIAKVMLENPARAASILLLQNMFGDVADITDSAFPNPLTRIANPLEGIFTTPNDIITAKIFS